MTNSRKTVLYTGVTSQLFSRIWDHKKGKGSQFTKRFKCNQLVHHEFYDNIEEAIAREKQIKSWPRKWKENLINKNNPNWRDLWDQIKGMD